MSAVHHQYLNDFRSIYINENLKNRNFSYLKNSISTGKYSIASFIPRFLLEQFSKWSNVFFLFTGLIQLIPWDLSPTNRYATLFTLSVVIILSGIKEVIEDLKRHQQDAFVNSKSAKVLRNSRFEIIEWKDIEVGDIIRLENESMFPADLILLSSSEPDALCYIETSNLDGETNLKIKQGLAETQHFLTPESVSQLEGKISAELPNNSLYTFQGVLHLNEKEYPLNTDQLLLRGAQLRNTCWCYAIVIYTGHETKLLKNSTKTPVKRTKIESLVNTQIVYLFGLLVLISLICSTFALYRRVHSPFESRILCLDRAASAGWIKFGKNILTFIILFNNFIPLSLIVSMEVVKFTLGVFMNNDLDMYHEPSNTTAHAQTSSLIEELGQIDYIFTDKTGTLTCNIMKFQKCVINGTMFSKNFKKDHIDNSVKDLFSLIDTCNLSEHRTLYDEFMILLGVCHTVIPERDSSNSTIVKYQASSPDEEALVNAAKELGVIFHTRKPKSITVEIKGQDHEIDVLNINEFNSSRKRMSCIVRLANGQIKLYVKGAETAIIERLAKNQQDLIDKTLSALEDYSTSGLRTLCVAFRDISESEYTRWNVLYEEASTSMNNRQNELDKVAELIEKNLLLIGATAIEDKLQDEVPETIQAIMAAGIKMWVLTGDRQETAINIGYSSKLLSPNMNLIICNHNTALETKNFLFKELSDIKASLSTESIVKSKKTWAHKYFKKSLKPFSKDFEVDLNPTALIIDGKSLGFALTEDIKLIFLELALLCKAVVCCRVSPLQKALAVQLVKDNVEEAVTLAIGDGANDCSMIQVAHVGVGISGKEGLQAARSADFSISQFRFLRKLLLVHGGWAYSRLSKVILYSFYKNINLYMMQFWFATQNGFSGQTLFETWSQVSSFNVIWVMAQPLIIGIFDQYCSAKILDKYPYIYKLGQKGTFYNHQVFWEWIFNAFLQSFLIFFLWKLIIGDSTILLNGGAIDIWVFGSMVYTSDLLVLTFKACLIVHNWVHLTFIAIFGSFALYMILFPTYIIIGETIGLSPELFNILDPLFKSSVFWLGLLFIPVAINLRDFSWKYYKRNYLFNPYHIAQEVQKNNFPDYRPRKEWFRKATSHLKAMQKKRAGSFAFSQNESGQSTLIRRYDTTRIKPKG